MECNRPRGRSFLEESPPSPTSQSTPSDSSFQKDNDNEDDDCQGGPVMYDPSLVFDDDDDDQNNSNQDGDNDESDRDRGGDSNDNNDSDITEEDEDDYYTRGRSRSRSVHSRDDHYSDSKPKGLSEEELHAQIEQAAKKHEKDSNKPVVRTGALKQREVQALKMGMEEASRHTKEEERLEEQAEIEAALREKEERSVSINNPSGRGTLQQHSTPLGVDPPMRRVKILLLGDSSVGKTSLIHRITDNSFKQSLVSTVGVDYKVRKLHVNGENVQVQLWDTAGSEKFHKITQSYYRGVHGIMLVFDVSNRKSFKHVSYWLSNISKHANEHVQVQLVGNKVDLRPESKKDPTSSKINKFIGRKSKNDKSAETEGAGEEVKVDPFVRSHEGNAVASKFQIKYVETSALNNTNIEESLSQCVKQVIMQMDNPSLMSSLREKLQHKKDAKSRLSSSDSTKGRTNSGERKAVGTDGADSTAKKAKDSSKDKDCVVS